MHKKTQKMSSVKECMVMSCDRCGIGHVIETKGEDNKS